MKRPNIFTEAMTIPLESISSLTSSISTSSTSVMAAVLCCVVPRGGRLPGWAGLGLLLRSWVGAGVVGCAWAHVQLYYRLSLICVSSYQRACIRNNANIPCDFPASNPSLRRISHRHVGNDIVLKTLHVECHPARPLKCTLLHDRYMHFYG